MWWVRCAGLVFVSAGVFAGEVVPGRYIVELTDAPEAIARSSRASDQQQRVRRLLDQRRIRVHSSVSVVANALITEMDDADVAAVRSMPGVKNVQQVEMLHLYLDRATALSQVPAAYELIGGSATAGAGIKIAILDTGIDISHPGFKDDGMQAPDGYPQISPELNRSLTNGKVIVVRSYEDTNPSGLDQHGHGTAVAMAAAGVRVEGPRGPLMGVAPKAWIGVYRVNLGSSGSIPSDAVLRALDDAVSDGMDVINMSFGQAGYARAADNIFNGAIAAARARGVIVVSAAGNSGPDPMSVDWTASLPDVLAVGASDSDRVLFNPAILLDIGGTVSAVPASNTFSLLPIQGFLTSVASLDSTGTACGTLPEQSLANLIALIRPGDCTFEDKLNHVQAAGAVAAIVSAPADQPAASSWSAGAATLPGWMVSFNDGVRLQNAAVSDDGTQVTLRAWQAPLDPNVVTSFSGRGPSVDFLIKPDVLAVGARFLTAGQTNNPFGELYSPTGFLATSGTSFSAPVVAGAAALLKGARQGFTEADYRSLLVNSASEFPGTAQMAGAGLLNVAAAVQSTIAVAPVSLSFGARSGGDLARTLTLKNLSVNTETFTPTVVTQDAASPALSCTAVSLAPGGTADLTVVLQSDTLAPGVYQGVIRIESTGSTVAARVPYWFAVPSQAPVRISLPGVPSSAGPGEAVSVRFRVQDAEGLPLDQPAPAGIVEQGDGSVDSILQDARLPGTWVATLRLGPLPGNNIYRLTSGDASTQVAIQGRR